MMELGGLEPPTSAMRAPHSPGSERWRIVGRKAKTAKEAAEGAYIIGEGMLGGKYNGIDFRKP